MEKVKKCQLQPWQSECTGSFAVGDWCDLVVDTAGDGEVSLGQ